MIPSCCILQMICPPGEVLCQVWLTMRYHKGGGILGSGLVLTEDVVWERGQCPAVRLSLTLVCLKISGTQLFYWSTAPQHRLPQWSLPVYNFQTTKWGKKSIPLHFSHLGKSPSPCWKWSWPSARESSGHRRPLWATAPFLRDGCLSSFGPCTATAGICSWIYSFSLLHLAF